MEHKGTIRLETDRLILRRFTIDDVDGAFNNWTSSDEVTKFLRWPTHKDKGVTTWVLNDWISHYDDKEFYQWAIELKELGEPVGSIGVVEMSNETSKFHIGYCIGPKWWRKGITSEALREVMNFLFDEVGANRIESMHDPNNPNSGNVMKKCGLKYEGTMKQADFNNQGIVDAAMYGLIKSER